jgi:hypothetical protein
MIGSSTDSCERVATAEEAAKLIEALRAAGGSGALSWDAVLEIRASVTARWRCRAASA